MPDPVSLLPFVGQLSGPVIGGLIAWWSTSRVRGRDAEARETARKVAREEVSIEASKIEALSKDLKELRREFQEFKASWPVQLNGTYVRAAEYKIERKALEQQIANLPRLIVTDAEFQRCVRHEVRNGLQAALGSRELQHGA